MAYTAADNLQAADRLLNLFEEKYSLLAETPKLGQARPDIAPDFLYLVVKRCLILYREISQGIEVVRVVHGARYLPGLH